MHRLLRSKNMMGNNKYKNVQKLTKVGNEMIFTSSISII